MNDEQRRQLFGDISKLVRITIEGVPYEVPEDMELLRCFQYLEFEIAFENFCWNASCENCAGEVGKSGAAPERTLCCQEQAKDGMVVSKLPEGVRRRTP